MSLILTLKRRNMGATKEYVGKSEPVGLPPFNGAFWVRVKVAFNIFGSPAARIGVMHRNLVKESS
jgi:hypothetical protein